MADRKVSMNFKQLLGACYDTCEIGVLAHDHFDSDKWNKAADWASGKVGELGDAAFDDGVDNLGLALVALLLATVVSDVKFNTELEIRMREGGE